MSTPNEIEHIGNSSPARIYLQPIAAPSILGLYGFAGATFMVAANLAHWYGDANTPYYLAPFAVMFGGLAQFLAGMWAYRARDGVATAMHGMWGAFWIAYGILQMLFLSGKLAPPPGHFMELGYWFAILAVITWSGAYAASAESKGVTTLLSFLAAGSTTMAVGQMTGSDGLVVLSGYLFMIAAVCAWYTATALMVNEAQGREVMKVGKSRLVQQMPPIAIGVGEPGVIRGQ